MFCDCLVNTVLALWAGDLGNPVALVAGPKAAGNPIALVVGPEAAGENKCIAASHQISLCAGPLVLCLGAAFFLAPPRGSSAAGDGPSWMGGTRAMPSGEI
jgi:hypothetical protein